MRSSPLGRFRWASSMGKPSRQPEPTRAGRDTCPGRPQPVRVPRCRSIKARNFARVRSSARTSSGALGRLLLPSLTPISSRSCTSRLVAFVPRLVLPYDGAKRDLDLPGSEPEQRASEAP